MIVVSGSSLRSVDRWLAVAGLMGGVAWIVVGLLNPTDADRATENFWSRLWAPTLFLIGTGFVGLRRSRRYRPSPGARVTLGVMVMGIAVMAAGNVAEYWLFADEPHGYINARNLSWIGLLLGALAALVAAAAGGWLMLRQRVGPPMLGALLALLFPATVIGAVISASYVFVPFGFVAIAVGIYGVFGRDF